MGGHEPLVEARPEVVAAEVVPLEGEVREGLSAIDDGLHVPLARHVADPLHREDLTRPVRDVAERDHARLRCHRALEALVEVVHARGRHRERDRPEHDPVATLALAPRREHARVVLVRREHLVAGREPDPELADLERLARVPRDRDLLGVATEGRREPLADALDLRLEHAPHVVSGRPVARGELLHEGLVH